MYDPYGSIVPLCKISRSQEDLLVLGAAAAAPPDLEPPAALCVENSPIFAISSSDSSDSESSILRGETTPIAMFSASDTSESESKSESSARPCVQPDPICVDLTPDGGPSERRWITWDEGGSVVLGASTQEGVVSVWIDQQEFEELMAWRRMKMSNSDSPGLEAGGAVRIEEQRGTSGTGKCVGEVEGEGSWSNCSALNDLIAAVERQETENAKNRSNDLTEVEKSRNLELNGPGCSNSKQRPKSARVIPKSMGGAAVRIEEQRGTSSTSKCIDEVENEGSWSNCPPFYDQIAAVERREAKNSKNSPGSNDQDVLKSNYLTEVEKSRNSEHNGPRRSNSKRRPKSARVLPKSMRGNA